MVQTKEARSARSKREKSSGFDCWNAMIGRCYRPKRKAMLYLTYPGRRSRVARERGLS